MNYKIIKPLNIIDKYGTWSQVEMLIGDEKGMRRPFVTSPPEDTKKKKPSK